MVELSNDMDNLMLSIDVAVIFVDMDLRIKKFTPAATMVINLIETDIGRPLGDLSSKLESNRLELEAQKVLDSLAPRECEVRSEDGSWYYMRIMAYRTSDNIIDGAVLTFLDITKQKEVEAKLQGARDYALDIVETVREPLIILDSSFHVVSANRSFYSTFMTKPRDTVKKHLYDLGERQWNIPKLKILLEEILPKKTTIDNFEVEHTFHGIGKRRMLLNARRMEGIMKQEVGQGLILLAIEDVTGRK